MTNEDPLEATHRAIDALTASGERGVLLTGWGGMADIELPETIMTIDSCPHSWLFPKMKTIIHHGGAGTTSAALRAGKPQIVTPFFADQPFWGDLVYKLGVATKPIRNVENTAEQLAVAIQVASQDLVMQRKADELGQKIRAEDGVQSAVEFIQNIVKSL